MPRTVKEGSTGADAVLAQQCLKRVGYYKHKVDGWFGPESVKSLKRFQSANGHTPDGVCGPKTWPDLIKHRPPIPIRPSPIRVGDTANLHIPLDRQDDKCRCCPSTWYMILSYHRVPTSEQEIATLLRTSDTTNTGNRCTGTPPSHIPGMIIAVNKKYNRRFKVLNQDLQSVGGMEGVKEKYVKKGLPVCLHLNPSPLSWTEWDGGHYVAMDGYKPGYCQINDPYWVKGSQVWEKDENVKAAVEKRERAGNKPGGVWLVWE